MKKCTKCGIDKDLEFFYKRKGNKYNSRCKSCEIERSKKYINDNKEIISEKRKKYYYDNHESKLLSKKNYDEKNRDTIKEKARNAYDSEKAAKYYLENKDKIRARNKKWIDDNKDYFNKLKLESTKKWLKSNPHYVAWRQILYRTIKTFNKKKEFSTNEMLGYSANELKVRENGI